MRAVSCTSSRVHGDPKFLCFQLLLLLLLPHNAHGAFNLRGQYTFAYAENVPTPGPSEFADPAWSPCGGLFLSFKPGTSKLLLAPRAPSFPPSTQVWLVDPVPSATGQYTICAAYQKPSEPSFLAYSLKCAKNEPFLAKGPSAGVGVRWTMAKPNQLFATSDRACKSRYQLTRFGTGTNASCAVPSSAARQRSLKLLRSSTDLDGAVVRWVVEQFSPYPYPQVLRGDDTICPTWEAQPMYRDVLECFDFGDTVAIHKNTILVGQTAAAFMFKLGKEGKWVRVRLPPPPPVPGGDPYVLRQEPYSVALFADLAVVGVPSYEIKPGGKVKRPGQVLVYQVSKLDAFPVVPRPSSAGDDWGATVQVSDEFLAAGDGKKIFIYRVARENGAKFDVAAMKPQATLAGGSFLLWGSTLAMPSGNATLIYEYDSAAKKWLQNAKINVSGPAALYNDILVVSRAGTGLDAIHLNISVYRRITAGHWTLSQEINEDWPSNGDATFDDMTRWSAPALDFRTLVFGGMATTVSRSKYDHTHKVFIYTKSGPGGTWARAVTVDSGEDAHGLGTGAKAVAGDVIVCGARGWGYVRSPPGVVYLYSRKRELALDTNGGA